jgi:hypothetical protein
MVVVSMVKPKWILQLCWKCFYSGLHMTLECRDTKLWFLSGRDCITMSLTQRAEPINLHLWQILVITKCVCCRWSLPPSYSSFAIWSWLWDPDQSFKQACPCSSSTYLQIALAHLIRLEQTNSHQCSIKDGWGEDRKHFLIGFQFPR